MRTDHGTTGHFAALIATMTDPVPLIPAASTSDSAVAPAPASNFVDASQQVAQIATLLQSLDEAAAQSGQSVGDSRGSAHENKLVQARLGMASGLYTALRAKHPPTASHCLRVALGCSSWAAAMELDDETRDVLEVAALLHDVGKIGVPDKVLLKAGPPQPEEVTLMRATRPAPSKCSPVAACRRRFWKSSTTAARGSPRGRGHGLSAAPTNGQRHGESLPLASRMLSIVDAFDSMTTDHVYRPARSRERALAELFEFAGSQFDPELVRQFQELFPQDQNLLTENWPAAGCIGLPKDGNQLPWSGTEPVTRRCPPAANPTPSLFEKKLIDNMHDGVVFVDSQSTILLWNTGVERLTGVSSAAACGRTSLPNLMDMCNSREQRVANDDCPVAHAISTGVQWLGRVSIMGRQGPHVAVDLHAIPVRSNDGAIHGATVLLHDVSSETSLEEKCQALHAQVAKDTLLKIPVITTASEPNGPNGPLMPEIHQFAPHAVYVPRKGEVNAWDNEDFVNAVQATGKKTLVMAGVWTSVCVMFPALDAKAAGFKVYAVIDASAIRASWPRAPRSAASSTGRNHPDVDERRAVGDASHLESPGGGRGRQALFPGGAELRRGGRELSEGPGGRQASQVNGAAPNRH